MKMQWFVLLLGLPCVAWGGSLTAPFSLESTAVLPAGVRNPRYINVFMSMGQRFGENGQVEPLGERLNKSISWQDVLDAQEDDVQRALIRSTLNDNNLTFDGSPGYATGEVKTFVDVKVPALAWGVTERMTLALAVPVYRVDIQADTGFVRSNQGQAFVDAICKTSPEKCNEAAAKLNNATARKLARLGYDPIQSEEFSELGDVRLISKYQLVKRPNQQVTLKSELLFPTGRRANVDRALDIPTGDGRFKLGAALIYNRWLPLGVLTTFGGYTAQLPHSMERRLPVSATDSLSNDRAELTRRWGDLVVLGANYSVPISSVGLTVTGGYNFQYQSRSKYSGPATDPRTVARYRHLEDLEPAQRMHSMLAALEFSTVEWYRAGQFALPFQARMMWSHPLAGRNVPNNDVVSGEMVFFF